MYFCKYNKDSRNGGVKTSLLRGQEGSFKK